MTSKLNAADGNEPWIEAFVALANSYGAKIGVGAIAQTDIAPGQPGPTAQDVAAASKMSDQERAEFIQSMVDRLAARLEAAPNDPAGWERLARAYQTLGDEEKAQMARRKAAELTSAAPSRSTTNAVSQTGAEGVVQVTPYNTREAGVIELRLNIKDGWHINAHVPLDDYLIPTTVTYEDGAEGQTTYPDPIEKQLTFNHAPLALYEGSFSILSSKSTDSPQGPAKVRLTFQACSDNVCLPPEDMIFEF